MVNSLLANPNTTAALRAALNPRGIQLRDLITKSLGGKKVVGGIPALPLGPSQAQSVSDLDWESGIFFTPNHQGPTYTMSGRQYSAGAMEVGNVYLPTRYSLRYLYEQNILLVRLPWGRNWSASLYVELPPLTGTYLITVQIPNIHANWISVEVADTKGHGTVPSADLTDLTGIVGVYQIDPYLMTNRDAQRARDEHAPFMNAVSCVIRVFTTNQLPLQSSNEDWYKSFGGFVITRL